MNQTDGEPNDWCLDKWCIVDPKECNLKTREVKYTARGGPIQPTPLLCDSAVCRRLTNARDECGRLRCSLMTDLGEITSDSISCRSCAARWSGGTLIPFY